MSFGEINGREGHPFSSHLGEIVKYTTQGNLGVCGVLEEVNVKRGFMSFKPCVTFRADGRMVVSESPIISDIMPGVMRPVPYESLETFVKEYNNAQEKGKGKGTEGDGERSGIIVP